MFLGGTPEFIKLGRNFLPLLRSDVARDIALGLPKYRMVPARSRIDVDLHIRIRELVATFGVTGPGLLVVEVSHVCVRPALMDHSWMDRIHTVTHRVPTTTRSCANTRLPASDRLYVSINHCPGGSK